MKRKDIVLGVLSAFFLTNALVAEMIGGKLIYVGPESFTLFGERLAASVGVLMWPVVFVTTDLVNEYFGRRGVRRLTYLAASMIGYAFVLLALTRSIPAMPAGVDDRSFNTVFGTSQSIIVGSLTAFVVSQLIDVTIFHRVRQKTGRAMLWLRSTGSTLISQMVDSAIVLYIGLAIPFGWDFPQFLAVALPNYLIKLSVAILMTPVIYLAHTAVDRFLTAAVADELIAEATKE